MYLLSLLTTYGLAQNAYAKELVDVSTTTDYLFHQIHIRGHNLDF